MYEPLKIAICEDTKSEEEQLLSILNQITIPTECTIFQCGENLLKTYRPQKFDLLLMDIYMDGMTGVEAISKIREIDEAIPVAFITTSTDHALESYRLSALKYIEKPFQIKDIEDILQLAKMKKENAPCLTIHKNGKLEKIRFSHILYLEQQRHQLNIYLQNGETVQIYEKLSALLPQLEEQHFFSSHKSFSVNLSYIQFIDKELRCFMMQNGKNVPIRRETLGKAQKALENYLFNQTRGIP